MTRFRAWAALTVLLFLDQSYRLLDSVDLCSRFNYFWARCLSCSVNWTKVAACSLCCKNLTWKNRGNILPLLSECGMVPSGAMRCWQCGAGLTRGRAGWWWGRSWHGAGLMVRGGADTGRGGADGERRGWPGRWCLWSCSLGRMALLQQLSFTWVVYFFQD